MLHLGRTHPLPAPGTTRGRASSPALTPPSATRCQPSRGKVTAHELTQALRHGAGGWAPTPCPHTSSNSPGERSSVPRAPSHAAQRGHLGMLPGKQEGSQRQHHPPGAGVVEAVAGIFPHPHVPPPRSSCPLRRGNRRCAVLRAQLSELAPGACPSADDTQPAATAAGGKAEPGLHRGESSSQKSLKQGSDLSFSGYTFH